MAYLNHISAINSENAVAAIIRQDIGTVASQKANNRVVAIINSSTSLMIEKQFKIGAILSTLVGV